MPRPIRAVAVVLAALALTSAANAQWPAPGMLGTNGFGGYGAYGGPAYGAYGANGAFGVPGYGAYGGYSPYGGYGMGAYGPYGGYGGYGYGPFNYSQQLYQQQSSLTQQIFQQQQQAVIGQIRESQGQLQTLDAGKQQLFEKYLGMSESEKADVRSGLMSEYLKLDAHDRDAWKRDAAVQLILGPDIARLDGVADFRAMSASDKLRFQQSLLDQYRSLPLSAQQTWQNDQVINAILGKDWWYQ